MFFVVIVLFCLSPSTRWLSSILQIPLSLHCVLLIFVPLLILYSTALPYLIDLPRWHHPDSFCFSKNWIKLSATFAELQHFILSNYTFLSFHRNSSKDRPTSSTVVVYHGGTDFLIRHIFTQFSCFTPEFSLFELSSVTQNLSESKKIFLHHLSPFPSFVFPLNLFSFFCTCTEERHQLGL